LLVVAVVAAALGAVLVYDAWEASQPASFTVDGTVGRGVGGVFEPLAGADVRLTNDANRTTEVTTDFTGAFSFDNVPSGGVTLNVTAVGYSPVTVATFVSVVYLTQATGLEIVLTPGGAGNVTAIALTPFPDLEQFVASVGSGAVLLGIIALVAGFAAIATARDDRPAVGVVGGAAGLLSPLVLVYLTLSNVFPLVEALTAVMAAAGSFTLALRAIQMAQTGPAPDPD
ncbi:MAG: carboxypeptidase-like regulatory domain-containing protein, partial [Thermoplasmata archaeon]